MREAMLPERDPGWCFFLSVVREEAAGSRPAAKKKAIIPLTLAASGPLQLSRTIACVTT